MKITWWIFSLSALWILKQRTNFCEATLCSTSCLLVSNRTDIFTLDFQTSAINPVISGLTNVAAIDVHFDSGLVFWSDVTELNIKRLHLYTNTKTTIISNIGVCHGLAVNWKTPQLFWTDKTKNTISVSDLDGNNQHDIISVDLGEPGGIALDPDNNFMFWTNRGVNPKIERATLGGDQRSDIVTTNLYHPNGLDLDKGNRRIFWVDEGSGKVESIDYNGGNRTELFAQNCLHPFGVALVPPFLLVTDWHTRRRVHKLDALTGKVLHSYSINGGQPMGVVPYGGFRQPRVLSGCSLNNGGCSNFCVPTNLSHECVCRTGLAVKQNEKTCEDKVNNFILFTDADAKSTNIVSLDVTYLVAETLVEHLDDHRPIALDFDPVEDRIYWSDIGKGRIMSAFRNASSVKILYACNVLNPEGLAIDHVGRNVYWTDTGSHSIEVGRLDGTKRKVLFKDGHDKPRAIVLDERNGAMYWTDCGTVPKIDKAEMDGSGRRSIVTGHILCPSGLTIDHAAGHLFWADNRLDTIEMSDLNGENRQVILSSATGIHPFGLALYGDVLYWTDRQEKGILLYNLTSAEQKMGVPDLQKPMNIHVFDSSLLYPGPRACSKNNGFCSDLCLLRSGGSTCACPTGITLKSDGRSCDNDKFIKANSEKFMIIAGAGKLYNVSLIVEASLSDPLEIKTNISRPVAVDYDSLEDKIYWTDVNLHLVARAFLNGSFVEVVANKNVEKPYGLAVDYVGRNLYWSDAGTSKIEVARLNGSSRIGLITSDIEKPWAILLDIAERKMFWSDWGWSPKIELCNMDGTARTVLVSSGLVWVNSLAMDFSERLLYWCDARLDRIERVDLSGNNRKVILDLSHDENHVWHPFGLALSDDVLYWSDRGNNNIKKYNMTSSISEVLVCAAMQPMELHIHNNAAIFNGSTSCSDLNGGCSHLCLPNPSGRHCFCPHGVDRKHDDALTCLGGLEGTNEPPTTTASPSTATIRPDLTTEPPTTTASPSTTTSGPDLTTEPPTTTASPSTTTSGPDLTTETPTTTASPSTTTSGPDLNTVSGGETKSNTEGRTLPYKLAVGILAGVVISAIFIFIYKKKLRGPTRVGRNFEPSSNCVVFEVESNNGNIHSKVTESQGMDHSFPLEISNYQDEKPHAIDAADLDNWNANEIIFNNSAALHLKYTTQVEGFFDSTGGVLNAAPNSDVQIITKNGTIPGGDLQRLFFNVIFDETALFQDKPEGKTLISPVIECGPHDINILKPVEIILPHCLYLKRSRKRWISVYRTDSDSINWEEIPRESEKTDQSKAWFIVKPDSIHIKTMTFSFWSVFACGGPKKKRATVFSSKPDPESDLIYLRFYIYSDNEDSRRRMVMKEKELFPESRPTREKPFKLYNDNKVITVKLTDIEEGWELDKTNEEQVFFCDKAHGSGFRSKDAFDFAVKPIEGRAVKGFSCNIKFQQNGADEIYEIYLNPGFAPLKKLEPFIFPRPNSAESCVPKVKSHTDRYCKSAAGSSSSSAPEEAGRDNFGKNSKSRPGLKKSQSLNVSRQRYAASCDLEGISHTCRSSKTTAGSSTSSAPEESDNGNLDKISKTPQDSKFLSSLRDSESCLKGICNRLDRQMPGVGDYHSVCSHYGIDDDTVVAVFDKYPAGPSRALLDSLTASHPQLTVAEFARVLREIPKRSDVAILLEEYDNQ